ncbi:hypothetical protein [Shimia abyssi]|uniref:Uncharacterized protein n=1 Tax=Shimia abyssi TaxID=1662395 RepID=A0A2P8F630_9RHOB|nr:hypothetical protein [Shimia abyssi]PSL17183.1 hypothetical protein CLV88_12035 [Shimia abyssi]
MMSKPFSSSDTSHSTPAEVHGGTCRMLSLANDLSPSSTPVVVIPDLTRNPASRRLIAPWSLAPSLVKTGLSLYVIRWHNQWVHDENQRFTPMITGVNTAVKSRLPSARPFHLAAIGNGALVALKWLTSAQRSGKYLPVLSLSLFAPRLSVFSRTPRTSLSAAPDHTCIVAHDTEHQATCDLAKRLPHAPTVYSVTKADQYTMSEPALSSQHPGVEFAGAWQTAWRDWMIAQTPMHDRRSA